MVLPIPTPKPLHGRLRLSGVSMPSRPAGGQAPHRERHSQAVKPLRISRPASAEFAEAVRWYEQKRDGLGGEFFDAVTHAIELIRSRPEIGRALAELARGWSHDFPIG
jgi:hypothetical protein